MQPSLTHVASLTHELATITQQALAWLPSVIVGRGSSAQLRDHCHRLRRHLALVRRHHKTAWGDFARVAGKEGFSLWNGDRTESAHQAVATIAHRLYQLLGGRSVVRCDNGPRAPAHLLRLELHLKRFAETLFPGFDVTKPAMPRSLFQALTWEHRSAHNAPSPIIHEIAAQRPDLPQAELIAPNSEWERLGRERREIFLRFHRLQRAVASAKDILEHKPSKTEEWHLRQLVKLNYLRKPGGRSGKDRRDYCLGRVPKGFPDQRKTDVS